MELADRSTRVERQALWSRSDAWQSASSPDELSAFLERVSTMPLLRQTAAQLLDLLSLKAGEQVLDVGCGTAMLLPQLATACGPTGAIVGVDRSVDFVAEARRRTPGHSNIRVDEGDAYALPYAAASFDAACCERVLMHLEDPPAALREMRRVVRPGGRVVVAEPDWASIVIDHPDHEAIALLLQTANTSRRQPHIGRELNRLLAAAGLVQRILKTVPIFSLDYADLVAYGLDLPWAADQLARKGVLQLSHSRKIIEALVAASSNGTFCAFGGYFIARGCVPLVIGERL